MITSNAISKVTNMASEKSAPVSSDFQSAMRPTTHHEPGDQEEARHVKAEPLRGEAESERRHEHLQHAA